MLDGELVPVTADGRFESLLARLHPAASRVEWLRQEAPVALVVFDLLAIGASDLRHEPMRRRRLRLEALVAEAPPGVRLTPATKDPAAAERWLGPLRRGGAAPACRRRSRLLRRAPARARRAVQPLIAPLEGHPWQHGFLVAGGAAGRLPGAAGAWRPGEMQLDWTPLEPLLVCEVGYDGLDGRRFRHPARFRRWRPDREALSCMFAQVE